MRIPSGVTTAKLAFVAVDPTDLKTRETGLTTFTVYSSRNGGTPLLYTTPTTVELSAANMPGVYVLTLDEDTTITAGADEEEYVVHITHASMAPVTRAVELYRPKATIGNTLDVTATGAAGLDWANVEGQGATVGLSATTVATVTTTATATTVTTVNGLAANVITATSIDADAITAAKVAADVSAEIADAVWDEDATAHQTPVGTFGQAIGDPGADADSIWALVNANLNATMSSRASQASVDAVQADTDDIQTRLPAALVGGRIDASVGAMAASVVTAAAIATDAIDSDAIAASAVTEIQTGLATSAALTTVQADTDDIQTRLPAALVGGRIDASIGSIGSSTEAASRLQLSAEAIIWGVVNVTGTTTTNIVCTSISPTPVGAADQFKGRIMIFLQGSSANLKGQATDITANTTGATPSFTVTALTHAPANGDIFAIL